MTASWQKIFSGDPKVGYWTQHFQYRDAQDAGKTSFGAAKNPDRRSTAVIRNTFIQGTLSIVFAVLVVIVFAAGVIMALQGHPRRRPTDSPRTNRCRRGSSRRRA